MAPHPATLVSPPLYLHCICAQMSTHVSRFRQTKRSPVRLQVSGINVQIHKKMRECISATSQWAVYFRSIFAQRKAGIWGAQVGALSTVPTDRSARLRHSHLLNTLDTTGPKSDRSAHATVTRHPAVFDWENMGLNAP